MRSTRQTVSTLLAIALLCASMPFVLEWAGFNFLSMELGGVGDHFAGFNLDGAVLRLDLILAFSGMLGLVLALSLRSDLRGDRLTATLAATLAVTSVVASVQIIDLPAGGMPEYLFRRRVFDAAQLSHVLAGSVLLIGCGLLRLRRWLHTPATLATLAGLGAVALVANLVLLRGYEAPSAHVTASHVGLAAAFLVSAGLLLPELRRHPLPIYAVATIAGLLPLTLAQLGMVRMGEEVDQVAVNRAAVLQWCAYLLPLLGLCIDLVRNATLRTRERERAYLRHVLDALPDLVYTRDQGGHYRLINQAAAEFLGYQPDVLEGTHMLASAPDPHSAQRALALGERIIATGRVVRHAGLSARDAAGNRRWMQWLNLRLDPGDGEPAEVLSVATDVTRLKNTEQQLARRLDSEKMLRQILVRLLRSPVTEFPEAMQDVMADLGQAYGADLMFAYEYDVPAGVMRRHHVWQRGATAVLHEEHDLSNVDWAFPRLQAGESVIFSDPDELPDAPEVVAYARQLGVRFSLLVPVFNKSGSLWGVLGGHFTSVPEGRGHSLQRVLGALADVYTAARDHYLAERELQIASRAASDSARAKGEFLANMSHEIRTPLNAVIGLADILRSLEPSAEQVQYLDMIQHAGNSLLGIINDVLDISKIEAGQLQLDPVPVDLPALLNEVVDMMAYHAQQQGLELIYHLDPAAAVRTELDAVRLKQVLINLLNNAIKFTEHGHVSLRVRSEQQDGRTWCRFDIADTGIGIPAATLDRIFEKFAQADASHTRKYGGTGLGLAICRNLVGLMGGTIGLKSKEGRGTLFTVMVPLPVAAPSVAEVLPEPGLAGRRFVAVMPSPAARESLATTLRELGLAGLTLADPADLAAHLARNPADLVLADAQMASVTLDEIGQAVDACPDAPPRVLLTPLGDVRDRAALARHGWVASLQKPVRRPVLRRELLALLSASGPATDSPGASAGEAGVLDRKHVLLVEDNLFNQKVAAKLLENMGCRVTVAENGERAVAAVNRDLFDLVLMDCQMPVMDGLEATRRIRGLGGDAARVPIVAMTANVMSEHREACLAAGMDDFASKPINKATLRGVLERWAQQREPELVS
jgi:PAS domain S-box-containing protein